MITDGRLVGRGEFGDDGLGLGVVGIGKWRAWGDDENGVELFVAGDSGK